jgi:hypothetical protein
VCLPAIGAVFGAASSIAGAIGGHQQQQAQANYANAVAARDYKYAIAKRDAEWKQTLSIWGHKRNDYSNQLGENYSAADRAYATEQAKLNETFMQAAFQQQGALAELIQGRGSLAASGRTGRSVAKMDQSMLAAYGRNNATIAENLASARSAMIRRNEQVRQDLRSANNKAWSEVALKPIPGMAPPRPVMQPGPSGLGLAAGLLGGIGQGIGAFQSLQAPQGYNGTPGGNPANFNSKLTIPGMNYGGVPTNYGFPSSSGFSFQSAMGMTPFGKY